MRYQILRNQERFGVSAIALRSAIRKIGSATVRPTWIAEHFRLHGPETAKLIERLINEGWLVRDELDPNSFKLTREAHSFSLAKVSSPLTRRRADQLLSSVVDAAKIINADGTMPHYVKEQYAFGTYLGPADAIDALRLGVRVTPRYGKMSHDSWFAWCREVGLRESKVRTFLGIIDFSELAVVRRLKQRATRVSIDEISDPLRLPQPNKTIFWATHVAAPKRLS